MKTTHIGQIHSDLDQIVIFSLDEFQRVADKLNMAVDEVIEEYDGIQFPLAEGVGQHVNLVHVVTTSGEVVDAALIGSNPAEIVRFLEPDEMNWDEYLKSHQDYPLLGTGEHFSEEIWQDIRNEYISTLRK